MKIRVLALFVAAVITLASAHAQTSTPTPTPAPTLTKQQAKEAVKKEAYLRKHPPVMVTVPAPVDPFAPTPEDKAAQDAQAARDQAYKAQALRENTAAINSNRQKDCLINLHAGDSSSKVSACGGAPDHTNSDLTTDQLVFANGVIVYIDKSSDKVENVQWSN